MPELNIKTSTCYHCGDTAVNPVAYEGKAFCCDGCRIVFNILEENNLCSYYDLENNPGISLKGKNFDDRYAFLDNDDIIKQLVDYASDRLCKITLYIPSIHCSSCIWLLEKLYKMREGVSYSNVNFIKKEVAISFDPSVITLRQLVELLATVGYAPDITLERYGRKTQQKTNRRILLKLGVTGFCTGNIMALSFPEYFGLAGDIDPGFKPFFLWLNVLLSLPVLFYGATDYFMSAYRSLRKRVINVDVPVSIGIITLFIRSLYETLSGVGPGYWDSLSGLVFFLLIGKWLQGKTYESLSFERNYHAYFPLAVTVVKNSDQKNIPATQLAVDDQILIRNGEIIPADSVLLSPAAAVDYSFVTGESEPVEKKAGDLIYAGGRQLGPGITLSVQKPVSQSYLTQLWNNEAFSKDNATLQTRLSADFSRYFTIITLSIAFITALFWFFTDKSIMWNAFTAVLIVACPCALSLSMPFTMENTMRIFGRNGFYVKKPDVIQHLATITHIVFDKTGTLTRGEGMKISFTGEPLKREEQEMIKSLTANSTHPLSRKIYHGLPAFASLPVSAFSEISGMGIKGTISRNQVKIGSGAFVGIERLSERPKKGTKVYIKINEEIMGFFSFHTSYRSRLNEIISALHKRFKLSLLSGDHPVDLPLLTCLFKKKQHIHFEKSPADKLNFIKRLQAHDEKVMMIGDGLNDAGALKQSDVGMVIADDVFAFFPACDVLADAKKFGSLAQILRFSRTSVNIVKASFLLSMVYNIIGLSWAVSGHLSPVFAAILMPVSSISVVGFAVGISSLFARWNRL